MRLLKCDILKNSQVQARQPRRKQTLEVSVAAEFGPALSPLAPNNRKKNIWKHGKKKKKSGNGNELK